MGTSAVYKAAYSMPLQIHNDMVRAMRLLGETNSSAYITRAVRKENKLHLTPDVKEFLSRCSSDDIKDLKDELKKGNY